MFGTAGKANAEARQRSQSSASQRRWYLPPGKGGELVILDDKITVGAYEHDLPIPGKKYKNYVPCIAAIPGMSCPLCRAGDKRTYRLFATILDLTQYTPHGSTKVVTQTKKLIAISQGEAEKWQAIMQDVIASHGTMRGTYIFMQRSNEQRSSRNGEPTAPPGSGGRIWQHMTEAELLKSFGHKAVVEGSKIIKAANSDLVVHNYDEIFPFPDDEFVASMEAKYGNGVPTSHGDEEPGGAAQPGSAEDINRAWEEEIGEGNPEDESEQVEATPIDGLGEIADGGDQDAAQTLTAVAAEHDIDPNALGTWVDVEIAINEARAAAEPEEEPEPEPVPKVVAKKIVAKPTFTKTVAKPALTRTLTKTVAKPVFKKSVAAPTAKPGSIARPNRNAFGG